MEQGDLKTNTGQRFRISLAQYSLHRKIGGGGSFPIRMAKRLNHARKESFPSDLFHAPLDPMDFPAFTRNTFDIDAVEYISRFYSHKIHQSGFLKELRARADDVGVRSVLMMVDGEGALGAPQKTDREDAVRNHHRWIDAAAYLGCYAIRVFAETDASLPPTEQQDLVIDGISQLLPYATAQGIEIVIENKGGLGGNGAWLAELVARMDEPAVGTLPDFGNFGMSPTEPYDYVKGVTELMPSAKGVSAKAFDFDDHGMELTYDFPKLMEIIKASAFHGYIGIEFEGASMNEVEGIFATKHLLEKLISTEQPVSI